MHTLILGGAKSGKSALALSLAAAWPGPKVFLATAQAGDAEMHQRIARHQAERGPGWRTFEEPLDLAGALAALDAPDTLILLDCLTLWLSNLLTRSELAPPVVEERGRELAALLPGLQARLLLVGNEVGQGIVPMNPLARAFRDLAGGLNQAVARAVGQVVLVTAGLPLVLKGPALSLPGEA